MVKRLWPVFAILGYFGIIILFCDPLYNTPLYDDWAYSANVKRLLESGELRLIWTQVSFVAQLFSAALFCLIFGFSFSTLHVYSLLLGISGILALYGLARYYDYSRTTSVLFSLALAGTPFYLHFCFTFMTDIPSIATNIIAVWAYVAAERRYRTGKSSSLLYVTSVFFFVFSTMVRDFAILMIPPMLATWYVTHRSGGPHRIMVWTIPLAILSHAASRIFVDAPYRTMKLISHLFTLDSVLQAYVVIAWIGLSLSPLIIAVSPDFFRRYVGRKKSRWILFSGLLLFSFGMAMARYMYSMESIHTLKNALMPYGPGFLSVYGPYNFIPLPGQRVPIIGFEVRLVLTVIAAYGVAVILFLLAQCIGYAIDSGRGNPRLRRLTLYLTGLFGCTTMGSVAIRIGGESLFSIPHSDAVTELAFLGTVALAIILFFMHRGRRKAEAGEFLSLPYPDLAAAGFFLFVGAWACYVLNGKYFIRYSLAMLPGFVIVFFSVLRGLRLNKFILSVGVGSLAISSVVITMDQISFNEARWAAGRWLLSRGVRADEIVGGFEFDSWHLEFRGEQPSNRHSKIGSVWIIPRYIITLDNFNRAYHKANKGLPGVRYHLDHTYFRFQPKDGTRFPYRSIMIGKSREIQIWHAPGIKESR